MPTTPEARALVNSLTVRKNGLSTINFNLIKGANIRLTSSEDPAVGYVSKINSTIENFSSVVGTSFVLEGVSSDGVKQSMLVSIDDIREKLIGGLYDEIYFAIHLDDLISSPVQNSTTLALTSDTASAQVFNMDEISVGTLIDTQFSDGSTMHGIVSSIARDGSSLTVVAAKNGGLSSVALPLKQCTDPYFTGVVLSPMFV